MKNNINKTNPTKNVNTDKNAIGHYSYIQEGKLIIIINIIYKNRN